MSVVVYHTNDFLKYFKSCVWKNLLTEVAILQRCIFNQTFH